MKFKTKMEPLKCTYLSSETCCYFYFIRCLLSKHIFTCLVFDESLGESNTERRVTISPGISKVKYKPCKNISRYFKRRHVMIYLLLNHKIW